MTSLIRVTDVDTSLFSTIHATLITIIRCLLLLPLVTAEIESKSVIGDKEASAQTT